jgi:hypothetical protein
MYFLLIIVSFIHKNWVLVLKEKSDAKKVLKEWKKAIELEPILNQGCKI